MTAAAAKSDNPPGCRMSASRMRMSEGRVICPSVPEAQMAPQAMRVVAALEERGKRDEPQRDGRADDAGGRALRHP